MTAVGGRLLRAANGQRLINQPEQDTGGLLRYACPMLSAFIYIGAALAEIAGCFSFWAWLRMAKSPIWLIPGGLSLALFAWLLTLVDTSEAGRAYAAYGGIYICSALIWLWLAEGVRPDRWDLGGAALCLAGACVIFFGPHRA